MAYRNFMRVSVFCLIVFSQMLLSQIVLQGTVTDNRGEYLGNGAGPVVNVLVKVTDQTDPGRNFSAYTDDQGHILVFYGPRSGWFVDAASEERGFRHLLLPLNYHH